jgi:hypothetical protein
MAEHGAHGHEAPASHDKGHKSGGVIETLTVGLIGAASEEVLEPVSQNLLDAVDEGMRAIIVPGEKGGGGGHGGEHKGGNH